jgi:hypothetical protein
LSAAEGHCLQRVTPARLGFDGCPLWALEIPARTGTADVTRASIPLHLAATRSVEV